MAASGSGNGRLLKIQFDNLPPEIGRHLARRLRQRGLTAVDLERLRAWAKKGPEAPDGNWFKDFRSFYLCGSGPYPKTVLEPGMAPFGEEIE